jgi:hypothetical protein
MYFDRERHLKIDTRAFASLFFVMLSFLQSVSDTFSMHSTPPASSASHPRAGRIKTLGYAEESAGPEHRILIVALLELVIRDLGLR